MLTLEYARYGNLPGYLFTVKDNGRIVGILPCFCENFDIERVKEYVRAEYKKDIVSLAKRERMEVSFADLDFSEISAFRRRVYTKLVHSVPGRTVYYGDLMGARFARAVGNAMKSNPFPVIVPCHRVTGKCNSDHFTIPCHSYRLCALDGIDEYKCSSRIKKILLESEPVYE